jgi:hypothetical protein
MPGPSSIEVLEDPDLPAQVNVIDVGGRFTINGHDLPAAVGFKLAVW